MRKNREPGGIEPTGEQLADIAVWWRDLWDTADQIERRDGVVEHQTVGPDGKIILEKRQHTHAELFEYERKRLEKVEKEVRAGQTSHLRKTAIDILKDKGFSVSEEVINQLVPILARAERDAFEIQARRRNAQSTLELLERDKMEYVTKDLRLSQLLEEYFQSTRPRIQTREEWEMIFRRLIDVIGDKIAAKVSKGDIRKFVERVWQIPTRPSKSIRLLPVNDMIQEARRQRLKTVSTETVRKHVSAVRAVFEWALTNEIVTSNPAAKTSPKREVSGQKRRSFSNNDLNVIFNPSTYCNYSKNAADYWVPLVCLFSGARIEEIAQLHLDDVRYEENIPIIEIEPNSDAANAADAKRVKNQSSARVFPIHEYLVKGGLMDFVRERHTTGDTRLFSELDRNKIGRLAREVSRHFMRYIRSVGVSDPKKVFHSFRHTFKDACRDAGLYEDVHDQLTGHSNNSVGRSYGHDHSLSKLKTEIDKVCYTGMPELKWARYSITREN